MGIVNLHVLLDCIIGFSSLKAPILNVVHAYMYDTLDYYSFNYGDKWSGTAYLKCIRQTSVKGLMNHGPDLIFVSKHENEAIQRRNLNLDSFR